MFLSRLNGDPIGFSVLGIFVIDKNTILTVKRFQNGIAVIFSVTEIHALLYIRRFIDVISVR